jgi:hypothetical protein
VKLGAGLGYQKKEIYMLTLGQLKTVLAVYDKQYDDLPVQFTSIEIGGHWPKDRQTMVIGSDHSLAVHGSPEAVSHFGISLMVNRPHYRWQTAMHSTSARGQICDVGRNRLYVKWEREQRRYVGMINGPSM